jgi:hypothetical protein
MNSELEVLIRPEIINDALYNEIREISSNSEIKNILEIGSSTGEGSTQAFLEGMKNNQARLFCLEISKPRYIKLCSNCGSERTFCFNMSSVPIFDFLTGAEVFKFCKDYPSHLDQHPITTILIWLLKDIEYIVRNNVPQDGIGYIKQKFEIKFFDVVLIDGSAFTGKAEVDKVYGAKWIILDDIVDIKNNYNHNRLQSDTNYDMISVDYKLRNGYSIFKLKG